MRRAAASGRGLLSGRTALIVGAGPNIGRAFALEMAAEGARIVLTDRDQGTLDARERDLRSEGLRAQTLRSDVTIERDTERLFGRLDDEGVRIDTLVNNVGIDEPGGLLDGFSAATWTNTFLTNVLGPVRLAREVARRLVEGEGDSEGDGERAVPTAGTSRGSILFVTSIHQSTTRGHPGYSSSKAALGMVIKELALELAPYAVRVNGIAPGYVRGDESGNPVPHRRTPLGQASVLPRYIGRAGVYLCSDWFSPQTTGTVLTLDAGLSLVNHLSGGPPPPRAGASG